MSLRGLVRVAPRFQRAIRIDADFRDPEALEGFICPPSGSDVLLSMANHVAETRHAAFTWTGPYGSGKSSLVIALGALLNGDVKRRAKAAQIVGNGTATRLWKMLPPETRGWRLLPVVGRRDLAVSVIGDAVVAAGFVRKPRAPWTEEKLLTTLSELAQEKPRSFGGLLVIFDEMGKFLEDAAAEGKDIYFFQQLAELASRSNGRLVVVGILHQAFEEYAHRISRDQRDEWAKVQGRYIDLLVNTAGEEQLELLARAIEFERRPAKPSTAAQVIASCIAALRRSNPKNLAHTLERCAPLHPVTAALLGPISRRRFGQNQRSIFGFLNSAEPHGFQDFLGGADNDETYAPSRLWDYLHVNLEPSILASPDGHRWSLAVEAIERCESAGGDRLHTELLKSLALIDLFKERSGLSPTLEVLSQCLPGETLPRINQALTDLMKWSLIIFKKHVEAYAIYAGSDFDIERALGEALNEIRHIDFKLLRSLASRQPIVAKRHYHKTGALRWFDVDLIPLNDLFEFVVSYKPQRGAMGIFVLPVRTLQESPAKLEKICKDAVNKVTHADLIIGLSPQVDKIFDLAREVLAFARIQEERPELAGDVVARREVTARLAGAQSQLEDALRQVLDSAVWFRRGKEPRSYSGAELSSLASDLADHRFSRSPHVRNELLNRVEPSTNAIAAQNALLKAMALKEGEPRLGINGFPAEGGLFASLLENTELYRHRGKSWRFVAPGINGNDPARLKPLWDATDAFLAKNAQRTISLGEIFEFWAAEPYGVKNGLHPILSTAYALTRRAQLALYRTNVFQPRFTDLDVDYLVNDPQDIQFRWLDLGAVSQRLLLAMADIVRTYAPSAACALDEPLEIARGLVACFNALEPWTKRTMHLSLAAQRIRNIFKHASDPNRFLFDDLGLLLGDNGQIKTNEDIRIIAQTMREGLNELQNCFPLMLDGLKQLLLRELQVPSDSPDVLATLRDRADNIRQVSGDFRLNAFIGRVAQFTGNAGDLEGLAGLATNKPPRDWTDPDLDQARLEIASLAQQFIRTEAFARVKGRTDKRHAMAVVVGLEGSPQAVSQEFAIADTDKAAVQELIGRVERALVGAGLHQKDIILAALAEISARYMSHTRRDAKQQKAGARG